MTALLSVNVNRIALLRNSRRNRLPHLLTAVERCISGGAEGITVHPRPDERHIRFQDVLDIAALLRERYPSIEFNIEGYPNDRLLELVEETRPVQCTLVPDAPEQATSDHGWDVEAEADLLKRSIGRIKQAGNSRGIVHGSIGRGNTSRCHRGRRSHRALHGTVRDRLGNGPGYVDLATVPRCRNLCPRLGSRDQCRPRSQSTKFTKNDSASGTHGMLNRSRDCMRCHVRRNRGKRAAVSASNWRGSGILRLVPG